MSSIGFINSQNNIKAIDGILYTFDPIRNRFLSIDRETLIFGQDNASSQYLRLANMNTPDTQSGYEIGWNSVIVSITAHAANGNTSQSFQIRRNNNSASPLYSFSFPGIAAPNISFSTDTLNIDIDSGDHLQVFAENSGPPVRDVSVIVRLARIL